MAPGSPAPLDLLAALLGDAPDPALVRDAASWEAIRSNAVRYGVAPLVAFRARGWLTGAEREWCDQALTRSWRRHTRSLVELGEVLDVLAQAEVPCLVLKGPVAALRHYSPPVLRKPSMDIDLAVRDKDLERASAALARHGYAGERSLAEARARSHHYELAAEGKPGIELHFRLSHGAYGIPVEEFFDRAELYDLPDGRSVHVLRPADEILHLVLHRAHGRFATLFHFHEIRQLWRAAGVEVQAEVLRLAEKHHFAGAFALTDAGFRARWKEPLLHDGLKLRPTWLAGRIDEKLYLEFERLSDPGRELPLGVRLGRRWIDLQLTDTPADAQRFLGALARVAWFQLWRGGWKTVRVGAGEKGR